MNTNARFAVKNTNNNLFFAGFDVAQEPIWTNEAGAQSMTYAEARLQALLFARFQVPVQKKPVAL